MFELTKEIVKENPHWSATPPQLSVIATITNLKAGEYVRLHFSDVQAKGVGGSIQIKINMVLFPHKTFTQIMLIGFARSITFVLLLCFSMNKTFQELAYSYNYSTPGLMNWPSPVTQSSAKSKWQSSRCLSHLCPFSLSIFSIRQFFWTNAKIGESSSTTAIQSSGRGQEAKEGGDYYYCYLRYFHTYCKENVSVNQKIYTHKYLPFLWHYET